MSENKNIVQPEEQKLETYLTNNTNMYIEHSNQKESDNFLKKCFKIIRITS